MLSDLESLEKRVDGLAKRAKVGDKDSKAMLPLVEAAIAALRDGKPARTVAIEDADQPLWQQLQLLTSKPILYVCNVEESSAGEGNAFSAKVFELAKKEGAGCVVISAKIESEISVLPQVDQADYLEAVGLKEPGLNRLISEGYKLLHLVTYFTVGPKEARAWTITKGTRAPGAAGVIHTDFEHGFIRAETIACDDYLKYGGEAGARDAGRFRLEGKEYVVADGDVMHFRFNT